MLCCVTLGLSLWSSLAEAALNEFYVQGDLGEEGRGNIEGIRREYRGNTEGMPFWIVDVWPVGVIVGL